jgi:hypothetical protein
MASGARQRDDKLHVTTTELATGFADGALAGASEITGAMECEHYASGVAAMWDWARPVIGAEKADAIGAGVVRILAGSEGVPALQILRGLAAVADGPIDKLAYEAAAGVRADVWRPGWLSAVGRAEVGGAARVGDPTTDDGTTVLFDLQWPDGQHGGMGVFIDPRLGGCAKHVLVGPTLEETLHLYAQDVDDPEPHAELDVTEAAVLVERAMAISDRAWSPELGETYPPLRGFVKRQLRNAQTAVPRDRELGPSGG